MAIITRCCCFQNVRSGSFAAGFYSLVLYTIILTVGALNLYAVLDDTEMFALTVVAILLSAFCFIAAVFLLIGLCVDSRVLLIPWLVLVSVATVVDFLTSLHLLIKELFNPFLVILFAVDFIILILNAYSLICVYSQYQEYCAGRGTPQVRGTRQFTDLELKGVKCDAVSGTRLTNDSAITHLGSISAVLSSSLPVVHSDINSAEESSNTIRKDEDDNFIEIEEDYQKDKEAHNVLNNPENSITFIDDSENGENCDDKN